VMCVIGAGGGDGLGGGLTAMLRREPAVGADDGPKLALAPVPGKDSEEVGRNGVQAALRREGRDRLAGLIAANQRARHQLGEILRIDEGLAQRLKAAADVLDLPLLACKVEQSGRVAPC